MSSSARSTDETRGFREGEKAALPCKAAKSGKAFLPHWVPEEETLYFLCGFFSMNLARNVHREGFLDMANREKQCEVQRG